MGHQLITLFGSGIETYRMIHIVVRTKRHLLVHAIDTAAAGIQEVSDFMSTAILQEIGEADHIAGDIGRRILEAISHSRLCRQVDYSVK